MTRKLAQFSTDGKTRARYDTAARWSELNPVLDTGEFGYDKDNNTLKVGDGESPYDELDSIGVKMLAIYPVGTIYMNMNPTSPAKLFGGTWEELPAGRVLIGQGTADSGAVYKAGSVGGEEMHTLSVEEMPSHSHTAKSAGAHTHTLTVDVKGNPDGWADYGRNYWNNNWASTNPETSSAGAHTHECTSTGGSQAHNNMQPYLVVYMWVRTA